MCIVFNIKHLKLYAELFAYNTEPFSHNFMTYSRFGWTNFVTSHQSF